MYDKVFSGNTISLLAKLISCKSNRLKVLVTYQRLEVWRRSFKENDDTNTTFDDMFALRDVLTMRTTGGQNFKAYVLIRRY